MRTLQEHINEKLKINKDFTGMRGPADFEEEKKYMLFRFNSYFCTCIISPFDMDKFTYNGRRWCSVVGHLTSKFKDKYDVEAEYNNNCIYFFDSSQYQPYERFNVLIPISRLSRDTFNGIRNYKTLLFTEFSEKLGIEIDEIPSENFKKGAGYQIQSESTHFLSALNEKLIINKNFKSTQIHIPDDLEPSGKQKYKDTVHLIYKKYFNQDDIRAIKSILNNLKYINKFAIYLYDEGKPEGWPDIKNEVFDGDIDSFIEGADDYIELNNGEDGLCQFTADDGKAALLWYFKSRNYINNNKYEEYRIYYLFVEDK